MSGLVNKQDVAASTAQGRVADGGRPEAGVSGHQALERPRQRRVRIEQRRKPRRSDRREAGETRGSRRGDDGPRERIAKRAAAAERGSPARPRPREKHEPARGETQESDAADRERERDRDFENGIGLFGRIGAADVGNRVGERHRDSDQRDSQRPYEAPPAEASAAHQTEENDHAQADERADRHDLRGEEHPVGRSPALVLPREGLGHADRREDRGETGAVEDRGDPGLRLSHGRFPGLEHDRRVGSFGAVLAADVDRHVVFRGISERASGSQRAGARRVRPGGRRGRGSFFPGVQESDDAHPPRVD